MAESGFVIDGTHYEIPTLDSFTMAEAKILFDCSGLALEDFAVDEADPDATDGLRKNLRNPGFIEALMVVAYKRGNPNASLAKARELIGQANLVEAIKNMVDEDDAGPPEPQKTELERNASVGSTESLSEHSGGNSTDVSGAPDVSLLSTGISA